MKNYTKSAILLIFSLSLLVVGCRSKQTVSESYATFSFEPTYMGNTAGGIIIMKTWGKGPSKDKAVAQAMKNAVNDIIFKGVGNGNEYFNKPLVYEVNARERYAEYFDRFFADGGEYANFVNESSHKDGSRIKSKGASRENYAVVVEVNRSALRNQLLNDGIIKK